MAFTDAGYLCDECGERATVILFNEDATRTDRCTSCDQTHDRGNSYAITRESA